MRLIVGQILSHLMEQQVDGEKLAKQVQGLVSEKDVAAAVAALHFVLTSAGAPAPAARTGTFADSLRAAKYEVDEHVLAKELEQLGLPKGARPAPAPRVTRTLTAAARRARRRGVQAIQQRQGEVAQRGRRRHASAGTVRVAVPCAPGGSDAVRCVQDPLALTRWSVDLPLASGGDGQSVTEGAGTPTIRLEFAAPGGGGACEAITADEAQVRLLVYELKQAREAMQAVAPAADS